MEVWRPLPASPDGPHSHPNQHTEAELKLIRDMRRRNPTLGMLELWHRLRQRGYTRCPESLFRVMRKMGLFPAEKPKNTYKPKPYEQMTYPGQRVQVDVKVVPRKCIADPELRLFQYTAIDEFTRSALSGGLSGAIHLFLCGLSCRSCEHSTPAEAYKWNVSRRTTVPSLPTVFRVASAICRRCLSGRLLNWASGINSFARTRRGTTARWSEATVRIRSGSTLAARSIRSRTLQSSLLSTAVALTTCP